MNIKLTPELLAELRECITEVDPQFMHSLEFSLPPSQVLALLDAIAKKDKASAAYETQIRSLSAVLEREVAANLAHENKARG